MNRVEHFKDFLGGTACVVPGQDVFTQEVERGPHPETVRFVGCAQGVLQRFPGHKTKSGLSENPEAKNEVLEAFTTGQKEQERAHLCCGDEWKKKRFYQILWTRFLVFLCVFVSWWYVFHQVTGR